MAGVNRVTVLGNLGQDPELRYTQSQQPVTQMSVATSEKWKDDSGKEQERTEWHRIVVWGKQAENVSKYLKKGSKVYVDGKLQTRTWEDKDGVKKYTTEIVAREVQFLDSKGNSDRAPHPADSAAPAPNGRAPAAGGRSPGYPPQQDAPSPGLDDIPF